MTLNLEQICIENINEYIANIHPYILVNRKIKIKNDGKFQIREANLTIPYLNLYLETNFENKKYKDKIEEEIKKSNKVKLKKVDRLSKIQDIEKIKENLIKTILNSNEKFSIRYGVELFFRDRQSFFEIVLYFSLLYKRDELKFIIYNSLNLMTKLDKETNIIIIEYLMTQITTNDNEIYILDGIGEDIIIEENKDDLLHNCYEKFLEYNKDIDKKYVTKIMAKQI